MKGEIDIIDNYRDLSIGDWQEIARISHDKDRDELDVQVKVMSVLTRKSEAFLLNLPIREYSRLAKRMQYLEFELPDFLLGVEDSYDIGGFRLIPERDCLKVTTAQYVDFQEFHKAGRDGHIVQILSCLLVPEGKRYCRDYEIAQVQEAIGTGMNVYDAMALYGFFYSLVHRINQGYVNLFGLEENGQAPAEPDRFMEQWGWVYNVDIISETCRQSWDDTWAMPAVEFLNIVSYRKDRSEREQADIEKWKNTH